MVTIRLKRTGKKNSPNYRVVVTNSRNKRDGRFIEEIGYYIPATKDGYEFHLKEEKFAFWTGKGAQVSNTVESLVKKAKKAKPAA